MIYLKLSDVMTQFDEWGCPPAESLKLFRKFMQAIFEKRLAVEGYAGKPSDQGKRKRVPKDLFESSAILDWGRTSDGEAYDILVDREGIHLHLGDDRFGDYFDKDNRPLWSGMQIVAEEAAPLLAELRTPSLPASLTLAEAGCWIVTRDPMKVSVTDDTCGSLERAAVEQALKDAASACRNDNLSVTGKLFGKRENIGPIAFDDNGFRFDGGGCVAPNGVADDLLAPLLVMEHSGRVVIGGAAWKERPVWLDVRFPRDELIRLWPARVGVEASVVSEKSFFEHQSAAGKASGKRRKDARQWTAHALELAIDIRSEEPTWGKERVAGEIQLRWKLPTPPAPGITTLKTFIGDCEKAGELPMRHAGQ